VARALVVEWLADVLEGSSSDIRKDQRKGINKVRSWHFSEM
jgi:hypothetical protein